MKKLFLLPGVVALTLAVAPMVAVHAQNSAPAPRAGYKMQLNLTDAQKAQMKQIGENTRSQIAAVLTNEQRAQWEAAKQQGGKSRQAYQALNLTDDQKARIRSIKQASKQEMDKVLTQEQRDQLRQLRTSRRFKPAQ